MKYRDVPIPVVFLSETRAHGHVVVEHHLPVASPRLTSFSSRWSRGRGPRARGTDAAAINSSGRKANHCSTSGNKELNYSSILCPLSRFGGSARPAGGIALPVGRGPSRPCPTLFLFRRPRCPARPRPPYKRPAATACSPHLVLLRLSDHPQQQQPNRQSFA